MKTLIRLVYISLIGYLVIVSGTFILSLFGFTNPYIQINELFLRYAITPSYDYTTFSSFFWFYIDTTNLTA